MIKANRVKIVILVILIIGGFIYYNNQKRVLTIGIFAGSNWDVPTFDYYKMIDETIARFERASKCRSKISKWYFERRLFIMVITAVINRK